jgi:hypothetical protein
MKLLVLAELIPLVLMGAAAQTPNCVEQRPANEASVTGASGSLEDLSRYSSGNWKSFKLVANKR